MSCKKDTITLFIPSTGDDELKIIMPAHYGSVPQYREEVKELFLDAVETLFEGDDMKIDRSKVRFDK